MILDRRLLGRVSLLCRNSRYLHLEVLNGSQREVINWSHIFNLLGEQTQTLLSTRIVLTPGFAAQNELQAEM